MKKNLLIFFFVNVKTFYHLLNYCCMIFGAWLVDRNVFHDTGLLFILLICNFLFSNLMFRRQKIQESSDAILKYLREKDKKENDSE
jgi:hypothetical protein